MKKIFKTTLLILSTFFLFGMINYNKNGKDIEYLYKIKRDLFVLMLAYPESIEDIEVENDFVYVIMQNKKRILYDDKKEKNFNEAFFNPDLEDTLKIPYTLNMINQVSEEGKDPGRIRNYELLNSMYGNTEGEVQSNLVSKATFYGNVTFTKKNNASESLRNALEEVAKLSRDNQSIHNYVSPLSGTFNYRYIQDTGFLSSHSYGIAIDLKRDNNDYWKWCSVEEGSKRIESYPSEIVSAFENNGFIWGGKWNHFDILHYEYRPEIILKAKLFGEKIDVNKTWDYTIKKDENTENIIKKINLKLEKLENKK